jgi:hypothetical protein
VVAEIMLARLRGALSESLGRAPMGREGLEVALRPFLSLLLFAVRPVDPEFKEGLNTGGVPRERRPETVERGEKAHARE